MPLHARVLAMLALVAVAPPAQAQSDYPTKPITLVVPLPPGGTNDIMARAVADKLSAALGQQVVVENRASAGSGTVATRAVAKGPADGYTLLLGYTSTLATGPHMFPNVGYDPRKDFAPIGLIGIGARAAAGASERELSRRRRSDRRHARPKSRSRSALPASARSIIWRRVLFAQQAGVKLQYIPYKGSQTAEHRLDRRLRQGRLQPDPGVARRASKAS